MTVTCAVCLDDKSLQRAIHCSKCESVIHTKCAQEHLLNTVLEPHCPGCRQEWSHEFLAEHLRRDWRLGPFKIHRENILLDREKSLIPDTQEAAANQLRRRKSKIARLDIVNDLHKFKYELSQVDTKISEIVERDGRKSRKNPDHIELLTKKTELKEKIGGLIQRRKWIDRGQYDPDTGDRINIGFSRRPDVIHRAEFIRPCPAINCRGFLSSDWRCRICSSQVCSKCGEVESEEVHECNRDIAASFQLIKKESKPCPKCGVPIHRISGCNHMFCTDCKTSFDWRTMEIHPDGNSNPHYWEWRTRQGHQTVPRIRRTQGCTGFDRPLVIIALQALERIGYTGLLTNLSQLSHLQSITLRDARLRADQEEFNRQRINFILQDITEEEWKVKIQRLDKKHRKARFVANIIELFIQGTMDILGVHVTATKENVTAIEQQIENLRTLCNTELDRSSMIFGTDSHIIHQDFLFRDRNVITHGSLQQHALPMEQTWTRFLNTHVPATELEQEQDYGLRGL